MSPSPSVPGVGSGSDMAAALSASMSGMAAALIMSSAGFTSSEMSSSVISQTSGVSDSAGTDRTSSTSQSPVTVQESSTWAAARISDDSCQSKNQRIGQEELSKKKLHSQQLQNIKFLTEGPSVDEPKSDFLPREISTSAQAETSAAVASQKQADQKGQRLTVASSIKDATMTKISSAPDVLETAVEGRKKQVIVIAPEAVEEPARSSPCMSEAPSSRSSILEEIPIPTVSKPQSAPDGSGQDDGLTPSMTIPASPTIKRREMPSKIPTSPGAQRSADAKYAGEKLDSRADRFRQEQRKLVKAIKSDTKIGAGLPVTTTVQGRELSSTKEEKRSSEIFENVVSGGCALSSRPSSLSDEVGGEADLAAKEKWKGESTPSPDETDSDACRSDMSTTSQTTSSLASQESAFPRSPGHSGAWVGKIDSSRAGTQVSTKHRLAPPSGDGTSGRTAAGKTRPHNVPAASLTKKQVLSSAPVTKVAVPTISKVTTTASAARTMSSSSSVASARSSLQTRSASSKPTSSTGAIKQTPASSTTDQNLKMCSKIPANNSKTPEDTSVSSKSSSPISRKSSGKGEDMPSPSGGAKFSEESPTVPEPSLRSDWGSTEKPSSPSSQASSSQHRHISGEAGSSQFSRVSKSSQRKSLTSANPSGSPRKIHERCQLEKSAGVIPKSAGQQGLPTPKLAAPRPSQLPSSVAVSSASSSPASTPTSASSKLSQDRTPRFV